jgi:hypothetical protein
MKLGVGRFDFHGSPRRRQGRLVFGEPNVAQHQIGIRIAISRVKTNCNLKVLDRLTESAKQIERQTEPGTSLGKRGIDPDRILITSRRRFQLAGFSKGVPQVAVRQSIIGRPRNRLPKRTGRSGKIPEMELNHTKIVVARSRIPGPKGDRLLHRGNRLFQPVGLHQQPGQLDPHFSRRGLRIGELLLSCQGRVTHKEKQPQITQIAQMKKRILSFPILICANLRNLTSASSVESRLFFFSAPRRLRG